jgi:hypothetical protein
VVVKKRSNQTASFTKYAQASSSAVSQPKEPQRQAANSKKGRASAVPSRGRKSGRNRKTGSSEADQNVQMLNVKTDSTPVFQSNSANSGLVTSLQKGDKVRSGGIEIIDPKGSLTLIQGAGRSGFVSSESLERKTPVEEARK